MSTGIGTGLRTTTIIASLGAGIAVTLATVMAFFGATWWMFDWFANFRWQLMWVAIACTLLYFWSSKGLASVVFLLAALVNAWLIAPLWLGSQPTGTGDDGVSVVAVDMYGGAEDSDVTLKWLSDTDSDVIIAAGVAADRLEDLLVDGSEYRFLHRPDEGAAGIAVVAKADYPVMAESTPTLGDPVITITVPTGAGTLDIITSWGPLATNADKLDALGERLEGIKAAVEAAPDDAMVIGSLGATRFTHGMRQLLSDTDLRDATEGEGYISTWPVSGVPIIGGWVGAPLDVALMTSGVTPFAFQAGPDIGVGHLPIRVLVGDVIGER